MIVQVHLLNGFHGTAGGKLEFPPTPGRLFSAFVKGIYTWHKNTQDDVGLECFRQALQKLEKEFLPDIYYTPVNKKRIKSPLVMAPLANSNEINDNRGISSPRCYPKSPFVYFVWNKPLPQECLETIKKSVSYISYFGSPKSTARITIVKNLPNNYLDYAHLTPNEQGNYLLHHYYEGRLKELESAYKNGLNASHPTTSYVLKESDYIEAKSLYRGFFIFQLKGDFVPLITQGTEITNNLRIEVLKLCESMAVDPQTLVAHNREINHASYFPLSNVGGTHSNGNILGIGVGLPECSDFDTCKSVIENLECFWWKNTCWKLEMVDSENVFFNTLKSKTWCLESDFWSSVTPVEVHNIEKKPMKKLNFQKKLHKQIVDLGDRWQILKSDLEEGKSSDHGEYIAYILNHCKQLNLPEIVDLEVQKFPFLDGSEISTKFISRNRFIGGRPSGNLIHCRIKFKSRITGPLSIGRGRNFGLGIMKPH